MCTHTYLKGGCWKFQMRGGQPNLLLKKVWTKTWTFQVREGRGLQTKQPSMGGVGTFSRTTLYETRSCYWFHIFFSVLAGQIGIIGGSGMNDPDIFKERKEKYVSTPYGEVFCF